MCDYHTPDELLTRSTFWKIIKSFVPNEYLETVDDAKFSSMEFTMENQEELVQYVLDNSNHKMRMYGSAKELTTILNHFRTFPMHQHFFECERSEPYNSDMRIYRGNNGKPYISKDFVYTMIQTLFNLKLPFTSFPHTSLILTLFLKIQEEKLRNCLEFILFDHEFDDFVESELEETVDVVRKEIGKRHPKYSLNDYIDLFTKILPESCTAKEIASLREYVIEVYNKQCDGSLKYPDALYTSYIEIKLTLDLLKRLSEKKPHWFSRWIDLPPKIKFKVPAIVRSFKDKSGGFFIEAELDEALKIYQTGHAQPSRTIEGNFLYTIDDVAVEKKYGTDLMKMTILQDNALEAYPDGTPIPTNFGVFVISGIDLFHRLFRRMIFVHKVFQKLTSDNMEPFVKYIDIIDEVLDLRGTRKYMLKYDALHRLEKMTADYWNEVLPQPAKDVRNAKPDGFTLQNLKNELVHLGLTNAFPHIADFAEIAYGAVVRAKREKYLRNVDLFAAIEGCQLPCVLLRYPILAHYLKIHGGPLWNISPEMEPMDLEQASNLKGRKPEDNESKKEIDELNALKDQLKTAKDQIKQLKDRKLDEQLSECQLEIESLKKKLKGHSNVASEIENLKRTVETGEDRERKLKEANQSLTNCNQEMKKKMDQLEAEKLRTTETNTELNERMIDLKGEVNNAKELLKTAERRLENEVSQRSQEMERLKESMAVEKDQMSREISNLKEKEKQDAELILKLEGDLKKEQKQNERQKLESELRLEVEKTNHAVDQIQLEKEFSKLREAHNDLSDVCDRKDQMIRDLRSRLSKFPGGLP